jgi:cytidine deaminase
MSLTQHLVDAAIALLEQRFANESGIAAAMATEDGSILTGVSFQPEWGGGGLCAETGPICEAAKLNARIIASVCISRLSGSAPVVILTPCGICQERLFHCGGAVEVAVPDPNRPGGWQARTLDQIQPYYWVNVYTRPGS